jgi:hypothetical protein
MRYPSGIDPNDIKEPEIRTQYEAELKENAEKTARELFQTRLHNINQSASIFVESFLRYKYTTSKEDQSELENLMKKAKLSPARTQKLRALFESANLIGSDVGTNLTKQFSDILTECQKIKPGMTRAELLKTFVTEGGLSTATHRTFVYRGCPFIKVDVEFILSDSNSNVVEERMADTISKISKPYLDLIIND